MKKLLPIFLVLAVFVTGCNFANQATEKTLTKTGDQVLDQKFYDQAVASNDITLCNQILDATMKSECTSIANAGKLTTEAVAKGDITICAKIELARYKTACEAQVQPKVDAKKVDEDNAKIGQQSYDKQNAKLCDGIKDENQKASCKYNILANQAIAKKDPSLCDGIGLKDMIEQCKNQLSKFGIK